MFKKILKSLREYKWTSLYTLILITLEAVIGCLIPFVTANLINQLEKLDGDMRFVIKQGLVLLLMALASLACGGLAGITSAKASTGFAKNLREDIFAKIQTFSFDTIDHFSSASLVTRLTTDVSYVQISYMMVIRTMIRGPLVMLFSFIMAYYMGGPLASSFVIIIPIMLVGLGLIIRSALPNFRRIFKKYDKLNEAIEENVRGMRVVKGFAREEFEKEKFAKSSDEIRSDFTRASRIVALNSPLMQFCVYFNLAFILILGSRLIITSGGKLIGVGEISAMLTYGIQIMIQLMMLTMIYVLLTISAESMRRIQEVLDAESTIVSPDSPLKKVGDGSIEFRSVNFKYASKAEKNALTDIDLKIKSGMTVGILGGTGDGKSSLVQLIPRLYDATTGQVLVAGHDVKAYDLTTLRDAVAFVLQKNLLFSGTIKENLRWGNAEASDADLVQACKIAQAHDFIMALPQQYDTKIEQGGSNVSGGQRQRLCIARALLKQPKILILDDSTSAVDTKTDALIRQAFRDYLPNTTKIIIAQRVASVEDSDLIILMENGQIVDQGKHEDLMARCQIYQEIESQQVQGGSEDV